MTKVMTLTAHNGSYDVNTPDKARKYLYPSAQEKLEELKQEIKELRVKRQMLYESLGKPNKVNVKRHIGHEWEQNRFPPKMLIEYFSIGDRLFNISTEISALNKSIHEQTDETFDTMFVRAARNWLSPEQFDAIRRYTRQLLKELNDSVYVEEPS